PVRGRAGRGGGVRRGGAGVVRGARAAEFPGPRRGTRGDRGDATRGGRSAPGRSGTPGGTVRRERAAPGPAPGPAPAPAPGRARAGGVRGGAERLTSRRLGGGRRVRCRTRDRGYEL